MNRKYYESSRNDELSISGSSTISGFFETEEDKIYRPIPVMSQEGKEAKLGSLKSDLFPDGGIFFFPAKEMERGKDIDMGDFFKKMGDLISAPTISIHSIEEVELDNQAAMPGPSDPRPDPAIANGEGSSSKSDIVNRILGEENVVKISMSDFSNFLTKREE